MDHVVEALNHVRARLADALAQSGRKPEQVCLVAVSKYQPPAAIRAAYQAGQRDFGENYVQELTQKSADLADLADLRWHMIGHVQRNKARSVTPLAHLIHTVDSTELAAELDKRAHQPLHVLVEVNVGAEAQKSGCLPNALSELLDAIAGAKRLVLRGLMCVPPHTLEASGARPYFDRLRELRELHGGAERLPELSMGMTADLEHAVAAGATIVRIGTAIFGERPKAGG